MKEDLYIVAEFVKDTGIWTAVTENIDYNAAKAVLHKFTKSGKVYINPREEKFFCIFGANNVSFTAKQAKASDTPTAKAETPV